MPLIDKEALEYITKKKLKVGFSYKDVWQNEHGTSFSVAKVMEVGVLQDIKSAVSDAIKEGKTLAQFKKDLKPVLSKKGWWGEKYILDPKTKKYKKTNISSPHRLKTIFNSNVRSSRSAGQWKRAQLTKGFAPYFIYELGPSKVHREVHASWEGTILAIDNPFWDYAYPPNGWGCKCFVTQITKNQAEKQGGVSSNPKLEFDYYINQRTNRTYKVLKGVNPAWSSNAGKFRHKVLSENLEDKLLSVNSTMAKNQIQSVVKGAMFNEWWNELNGIQAEAKRLRNREYNWQPVAYINNKIVYEKPIILRLTEETAYNKKSKHDAISVSDYQKIQNIIDNGNMVKDSKNSWKATHTINNANYKVSFKVTANNEYILNTYHKIQEKQKN